MAKLTLFLNDEEYAALNEFVPGWRNLGARCPTCDELPDVPGTYLFRGYEFNCELDEFGRHKQRRLFDIYSLAGIPKEFMTLSWHDFPTDLPVKDFVDDFLEHYRSWKASGRGITFLGTFGTGKTWACAHILKVLAQRGVSVYYMSFWNLINLYREPDEMREYVKDRMLSAETLVIDDILMPTTDAQRNLFEDKLEEIIRQRAHGSLPTLITSNLTKTQFKKNYPRVHTVLSGKNLSFILEGDDYRPTASEDAFEKTAAGEIDPIT